MTPDITEHIKELAAPLADEKGLFLVDIELKTGGATELWIYLDGEERGVNLDECAEISHELGFLIDAHELLESNYRLNVSSPGLSRPLTDRRQYRKNLNRTIKVRAKGAEETDKIKGTLRHIEDDFFVVAVTEGKAEKQVEVRFDQVIEAKIIPQI
jgi:ribosome maturation factor RimP